MCTFILLLCVSHFLVPTQEQVHSKTVDQNQSAYFALFPSGCSRIPAQPLCCLLSYIHIFVLAPNVRCFGHTFFWYFTFICSQKPCTTLLLCPLQNCSSTPLFLLPFYFAPLSQQSSQSWISPDSQLFFTSLWISTTRFTNGLPVLNKCMFC